MPNNRIGELIRRFNKINGGNNYSQRDLLKYIIGRIDDIDNKVNKANIKLDNHIRTNSMRITAIETSISNFKWFFGSGIGIAIIVAVVSLLM